MGSVGFEPANPSLVSKVRNVSGGAGSVLTYHLAAVIVAWEWPGVSWSLW
jgi:hypothetical protein